jgi:hypothetical protein
MGEAEPVVPDPQAERQKEANDYEAHRRLRGAEGYYSRGRTWHEVLAGVEKEPAEAIPWVVRLAVAKILQGWEYRQFELRRGDDRPNSYPIRELQGTLLTQRDEDLQHLGGEKSFSARAGTTRFPRRPEIPVLDELGRPRMEYAWEQVPKVDLGGQPIYKRKQDGELVKNKAGNPVQDIHENRIEMPVTKPVSDEQLKAAASALGEGAQRISDFEWVWGDMAAEQEFSADLEDQTRKGFGAGWKNEPHAAVLGRIFRSPEIVPGLTPESEMLQAGIDSFLEVGTVGRKDAGLGLKDIFTYPFTEEDYEMAMRYATARILNQMGELSGIVAKREGEEDYMHALRIACQVPRLERAQASEKSEVYLYARSVAQRAKMFFDYLWLDTRFGTWKKGKLEPTDKRCAQAGVMPGVPEYGIEVGKLTGKDALKLAEAGLRLLSESKGAFPFKVGAARSIAAAMPRLTFDDLALSSATWTDRNGRTLRLSFKRLMEMGVSLADLPWTESCTPELKEKFVQAYGLTSAEADLFDEAPGGANLQAFYEKFAEHYKLGEEERAMLIEGGPAGLRADGEHVPVGLQRFYCAGQWMDLTGSDVDRYCAKMKSSAGMYSENKDIYLMFAIMSGELMCDDPDFILKLVQYYKVHKLGAAYMMMTTGGEETFSAGLADKEATGLDYGEGDVKEGMLENAREQALYLYKKGEKKFRTVRGGRDAMEMESELFDRIIGEDGPFIAARKRRFEKEGVVSKGNELDRGGVSPKDSGWFTDEELVRWVSQLYPQGVGYTQAEIKALLVRGTIQTVDQLDRLGWTGTLSAQELGKLKSDRGFTNEEMARVQALAL